MDDNRFARDLQNMENQTSPGHLDGLQNCSLRELNVNITGAQAHWIKWSYKKKGKLNKALDKSATFG